MAAEQTAKEKEKSMKTKSRTKSHDITNSTDLVKSFEAQVDALGAKFLKFPWDNASAYADWLAQTYYFVRHTTTLMCLSAAGFGADRREKHYGLLGHLKDELGHDLLLLNDLKHLDRDISEFSELPETALFWQNQFYILQHHGPASHLGYSLCLEGVAARYCSTVYRQLIKHYGEKGAEFVNVHANVDVDHYAHGAAELVHLNEKEIASVQRNLEQSALLYGLMLEKVAARNADFGGASHKPAKSA